jgi:hypothetical protein
MAPWFLFLNMGRIMQTPSTGIKPKKKGGPRRDRLNQTTEETPHG